MGARLLALVLALLLLPVGGVSIASELEWSGGVQMDTHLRLNEVGEGPFYGPSSLEPGIARNEGRLKLKLSSFGERYAGIADLDFVWLGVPKGLDSLADLSLRERTDPYRLETHGLYIDAPDVFGQGLDLRVGFQKVMWGVGDQFNPTNNLNSEDLEDPLLFGDQQANFMVKFDASTLMGESNELTLTAVVVPVFKPALLPTSGFLGLAQTERLPFVDATWNQVIASQQALAMGLGYPVAVTAARPDVPDASFENVQAALALSARLGDHDVALSYYVGRNDMPMATEQRTREGAEEICDPSALDECVHLLETEITLSYPRMQVLGLNATGEVDLFAWLFEGIYPLGYRLEVGLFFPERQQMRLFNDFRTLPFPDGEYDYTSVAGSGGVAPEVLRDEPFAKWTLGLDYSFAGHFYVNAQWVHGLVDEFGAGDFITEGYSARSSGAVTDDIGELMACVLPSTDGEGNTVGSDGAACGSSLLVPRLADYLVLGVDYKFMDQSGLLRLFTIFAMNGVMEDTWDPEAEERVQIHHGPFSEKGMSLSLFPQIAYNFGDGLVLSFGGLLNLGEPHTKFGDPATGGNLLWARSSYRF